MSQLRRYVNKFIDRVGTQFDLDAGAGAVRIRGRLTEMTSVPRLVSGGSTPFVTKANVFEFLTKAAAGVVSGALLSEIDASVAFLLYVDYAHRIADEETHEKVFALRVNQSGLAVRRMAGDPAGAGGASNELEVTPVAASVSVHFFEAAESIDMTKDGRTENFDGVLVAKQGLGIAEHDLVEINNKWYEFVGSDVDALPGLDAWRMARYKRKVVG